MYPAQKESPIHCDLIIQLCSAWRITEPSQKFTCRVSVFTRTCIVNMSFRRPDVAQSRPSFASRTAFELLAPEEDQEEDEEEEDPSEEPKPAVVEQCGTHAI